MTAFPNAVNIGASWDPALASRFGAALGAETRAKGHSLLFAPTLNIVRTPLWGRAAETYSEDPFLTSELVVPEVRGIQSARVMAEPKHYAGNNQEIGRLGTPLAAPAVDDRVSRRTLEEIYFPGFKAAVQRGRAASVMCSYNRINGVQSCENPSTLGILKGWGLRGFVEPDAIARGPRHGCGGERGRRQLPDRQLRAALQVRRGGREDPAGADRRRSPAHPDRHDRRRSARRAGAGRASGGQHPRASSAGHQDLGPGLACCCRTVDSVLPLSRRDRSIAVIGHDAGPGTQIMEGGSASVVAGGHGRDAARGYPRSRAARGPRSATRRGHAESCRCRSCRRAC